MTATAMGAFVFTLLLLCGCATNVQEFAKWRISRIAPGLVGAPSRKQPPPGRVWISADPWLEARTPQSAPYIGPNEME